MLSGCQVVNCADDIEQELGDEVLLKEIGALETDRKASPMGWFCWLWASGQYMCHTMDHTKCSRSLLVGLFKTEEQRRVPEIVLYVLLLVPFALVQMWSC